MPVVHAPQQAIRSVFLTDDWRRACIDSWRGRASFRELQLDGDATPVTALIGERTELRHGALPVRVRWLNQSGVPALDQPWIEHNGFFGGRTEAFGRQLSRLLSRLADDDDWDELRLPGLVAAHAAEAVRLAEGAGLRTRVLLQQPTYRVELATVRERYGGDYLSALGAGTRQQLRRSRRLAERAHGPLQLHAAGSAAEALAWFEATAPLHRTRWGEPRPPHGSSDSGGSGFGNPAFVAFHRQLIADTAERGRLRYLRLSAGARPIAYLYNLVRDGHVHFYLSGIDYAAGEAIRPGMLAHWLAIEDALERGCRVYDFLAGEARYKRSLSTHEDRALWLVLQRPRWRLRLEDAGRGLRRMLRGFSPALRAANRARPDPA